MTETTNFLRIEIDFLFTNSINNSSNTAIPLQSYLKSVPNFYFAPPAGNYCRIAKTINVDVHISNSQNNNCAFLLNIFKKPFPCLQAVAVR